MPVSRTPGPGLGQFICQAEGLDVLGRELENPFDEIARGVVLAVIVSVARIGEHGVDSPLELLLGMTDVFDAVVSLLVVGVDEKDPRPGVDGRRVVVRRSRRAAARQQIPDLLLFAADLRGPAGGIEGRGCLLKEVRHLACSFFVVGLLDFAPAGGRQSSAGHRMQAAPCHRETRKSGWPSSSGASPTVSAAWKSAVSANIAEAVSAAPKSGAAKPVPSSSSGTRPAGLLNLLVRGESGLRQGDIAGGFDFRESGGDVPVVGVEGLGHHDEVGGFLRVPLAQGILRLVEKIPDLGVALGRALDLAQQLAGLLVSREGREAPGPLSVVPPQNRGC